MCECASTSQYIMSLRKSRRTGTEFRSFTLWGGSAEGDLKLIGERRWRRGVRRNKLRVGESGGWCIPTVFRIKSFGYIPFTLRPRSLSRIIRGNCLILRKFPGRFTKLDFDIRPVGLRTRRWARLTQSAIIISKKKIRKFNYNRYLLSIREMFQTDVGHGNYRLSEFLLLKLSLSSTR